MPLTLDGAIALATRAHAGQVDRSGVPYIEHPLGVMRLVAAAGYGLDHLIAAVGHDTVEDTRQHAPNERVTLDTWRARGASEAAVGGIDAVTRREGPDYPGGKEPYQGGLIARAASHDIGRVIKLFDGGHNSLPRRALADDLRNGRNLAGTRYLKARVTMLAEERRRREQGLFGVFPLDPGEFLDYVIALDEALPR